MPQMNATAVIPLTDKNVDFLRKIQMNHPIPEGAKYIAFLEDGDACFLHEELRSDTGFGIIMPLFTLVTMFENIPIDFED